MIDTKKIRKYITWRFWALLFLLSCVYVASILFFVFSNVRSSELKGGGNGPADAYRHSLSSALVAHTLSPKLVYIITDIMEHGGVGDPSYVMDKHNNLLGAKIGDSIPLSWDSIQEVNQKIRKQVANGKINATDAEQIQFMPENRWVNRRYY